MLDGLDEDSRRVVEAVLAGRAVDAENPADGSAPERSVSGEVVSRLIRGAFGPTGHSVRINGYRVVGDIDISYADWRGELNLERCQIEGDFRAAHAMIQGRVTLDRCSVERIWVPGAKIEGVLFARRVVCRAGLYALGIQVSGSVNLDRSWFVGPETTPNRCAIDLFRARVGDVFLTRTVAVGGIYANGIVVDRNLRLGSSVVWSRQALGWAAGPDSSAGAISLMGATVGGALNICWKDPARDPVVVAGNVVLTRVTCESLRVRPSEIKPAQLELDHLVYTRLLANTPEEWLSVLRQSPGSDLGFATHPYAQLAAHCASIGKPDLQRRVLIALERERTRTLRPWTPERAKRKAWQWSVMYGYQPSRAVYWLGACAFAGFLLLSVAGGFLVADAHPGGPTDWETQATLAVDNLLPFAGLGLAKQWSAQPSGALEVAAMFVFVTIKLLAWGFAALGLASVTGSVRR